MHHIDQHTLELFVLGDESVLHRSAEIQDHLDECVGCRSLKSRIEILYEGLNERMAQAPEQKEPALLSGLPRVVHPARLTPTPLQKVRASYDIRSTPLQAITNFVRAHPIRSSMATMFALMLVAIGGNYLFRNKQPDSNISYYHYNVGQNKLEVYDSLNHLLWSAPTPLAEDAAITEKELRRTYTIIMDLAGRGENSLVTTLPLGKMKHSSEVQVYKKDGKLVEHRSFENTKFSFLRTQYDGPFIPSDLVLFGSTGTAHTVIVSASTGRSPNIAARLDSSLGVLGRFWHYGSLSPYRVDSVAGVGSALVLIGQNDVSDATDRTFCVMIIVDPGKIVNDQESSATKGFGLASSDAELYYVRFPRTDMEMVSNQFVIPQRVDDLGASALSVKLQTRVNQLSGPNQSGFDYFFSKKDLRVIDVRFNTPTERTHRILKRQGKIHSQFDRSYLENLKGRVSYWDGAKWIPVPTRIPH